MDDVRPVSATSTSRWDLEADVVVVGFGAAGACAALEADGVGADTLVLEAAGAGGGTSAMSGGILYLGGGTPLQAACGMDDKVDSMYDFLMAASAPGPDEEKIRACCDNSLEHYAWLVDKGIPFKGEFYPEPGLESPNDAGLVYTGGEDAWPFTEVAPPAARGHKPQVNGAAGGFLMERLITTVDRAGVRVECDVVTRRLIVDDGAAVGVRPFRGASGGTSTKNLRMVVNSGRGPWRSWGNGQPRGEKDEQDPMDRGRRRRC